MIKVDDQFLLDLANGPTDFYWSSLPGKVVDIRTGHLQEDFDSNAVNNIEDWCKSLFIRIQKVTKEPCLLFCGFRARVCLEHTDWFFREYSDPKDNMSHFFSIGSIKGYPVFIIDSLPENKMVAVKVSSLMTVNNDDWDMTEALIGEILP